MCDPVSAAIASAAIGAGATLYGQSKATAAQQQAAQAAADQNRAMQTAQNEAFQTRIGATLRQTDAQQAAEQETLNARAAAANQMRDAQMGALKNYQDILGAQNRQAEQLRAVGDTAAQDLLQQTNEQRLQEAQDQKRAQAEELLSGSSPPGPEVTSPFGAGGDPETRTALARRAAEAATNIRNYGSKVGTLGAYGAPVDQVSQSIADTRFRVLPAQAAERLLQAGSTTQLLPSQTAYRFATSGGEANQQRLQLQGQSALDAAGLSYGNAVDIANLKQSNANVLAGNTARQQTEDARAAAAQAGIISGIGKLGAYGAGYFGGNPFSNAGSTFGSQGPVFGNPADISIAAGGPPLSPTSTLGSGGFLSRIF